jgi:hypothetical protein
MYILLISILVFVLCYISNFSFGLYYNTKVLFQKISKTKLKNTVLKLISFIVGLTCLSVASYLIPNILTKLNLSVNIDITDKSIAVLFGSTSIFYASQSLVKLKNILLKNNNNINNINSQDKIE